MAKPEQQHLAWPAECFFWTTIDSTVLPRPVRRGAARRRQLAFLAEADLPLPLRDLQIAYAKLDSGAFLACAIPRASLEKADCALSLCPASIPEFLGVSLDPRALNLLTGEHEPLAVRQERRRWRRALVAVIVLVVLALAIGAELRIRSLAATAARAEARVGALHAALGYDVADRAAAAKMTAELRELEAALPDDPAASDVMPDATPLLAALLTAWPDDAPEGFETLAIGPDSIAVSATVTSPSAAQRLASTLSTAAPGWAMRPPQLVADRASTRATIVLEPEGAQP